MPFRKGSRVMFSDKEGVAHHGTVRKASRGKLEIVEDGGRMLWAVPEAAARPSDAPIAKDDPHEMDRYDVRNYEEYSQLSEETVAFSCILTRDGKPFAQASNDGNGGANRYHVVGSSNRAQIDEFMQAARRWAADFGAPDMFEPEAFWLDWKESRRPYNVSARQAFAEYLDEHDEPPVGPSC